MLQMCGVGLLAGAAIALSLVAGAGADPASGDIVPTAAQPQSPFTSGIPYASGQNINVVIPANSAFAGSHLAIKIVECSAPNGVVPTQTSACDGATVNGKTLLPSADGSFSFTNYTLYALPNANSLGESGGPACGQTADTECILYVGNDQNDFTQPHLWSAPFYIAPNDSDNGTPAGDGSPPAPPAVPDATKSTVVVSPTTAVADGVDQSSVTVTLLSSTSVPVAGKAVTLACTASCSAHISGPSPATTDANGQTTFTITDTAAEVITLQATDTTDTVSLTPAQAAGVTFAAPAVSATHSTVTASPTNPPADGSTPTTITVTLRDQGANPQPVAGHALTLGGTGSAVIAPATPVVTDSSGVATFKATDTVGEIATFTATDTTSGTTITNTASVTFGTLMVSATQSTVTVDTPAQTGALGTTAVVTLLTSTGNPVSGKTVTLQASSGTSAVVGTPSPATTGADGKVSFPLTDTVAESATLTATDTTDGIALAAQPTVVFQSGGTASGTTSTLTAGKSTAPADGETQTLITAVVKDQFGNPLSGKTVTLTASPSGNALYHPIAVGGNGNPGITDSTGTAEFDASDTKAEPVTFTATDTTDSVTFTATVQITFQRGPADPTSLGTTVTASPTNPPADGSTATTITVTMTDHFLNPVPGDTIKLDALNGSSTIVTTNPVTDQSGKATFTATDATEEVVTYRATDVTDDSAALSAEAVVTFGNPPAPPAVASFCSVIADPSSVPADGSENSTVSVRLYDGDGSVVSGKTVTLSGAGGNSKVTAVNGTTDDRGLATFAVSDTAPESVTFTAHDTSDSVDLTALAVTVTFTAATGSTTSTTTTTPPSTTSPAPTSTVASGGTSFTGNTGTASVSTASLASTGTPALLPWLVGFGALFLGVGTMGRRRFNRRELP